VSQLAVYKVQKSVFQFKHQNKQ